MCFGSTVSVTRGTLTGRVLMVLQSSRWLLGTWHGLSRKDFGPRWEVRHDGG